MKLYKIVILGISLLGSSPCLADHEEDRGKAALGGGIGGAVGAAIGSEVGGREGAILGSAAGAAVGTAISTSGSSSGGSHRTQHPVPSSSKGDHPHYRFCPPGQAKKGRC